jgi:hypothetical protein
MENWNILLSDANQILKRAQMTVRQKCTRASDLSYFQTVLKPHYFYTAPSPVKNFDAAAVGMILSDTNCCTIILNKKSYM